jgi:hypothetical protein
MFPFNQPQLHLKQDLPMLKTHFPIENTHFLGDFPRHRWNQVGISHSHVRSGWHHHHRPDRVHSRARNYRPARHGIAEVPWAATQRSLKSWDEKWFSRQPETLKNLLYTCMVNWILSIYIEYSFTHYVLQSHKIVDINKGSIHNWGCSQSL